MDNSKGVMLITLVITIIIMIILAAAVLSAYSSEENFEIIEQKYCPTCGKELR